MASPTICAWSSTASDNATADSGLTWSEGQAPSTVNDSARVMMKRVADLLKDLGGVAEAAGTANALTLTTNNSFTAYRDGLIVTLRAASANTGETTLNVNAAGVKPIVKMSADGEAVLVGGEVQTNGIYEVVYSEDLNAGVGAWLLINPSGAYAPSGLIAMWSGTLTAIPAGWVLCDGTNSTPDLTNMFIVGAGDTYDIGDTGGSASVTLTAAQLPSHTHAAGTLAAASAGAHTHANPAGGGDSGNPKPRFRATGGNDTTLTTSSAGAHTHTITGSTAAAGSGDAHENRPPYYALAFIMKT